MSQKTNIIPSAQTNNCISTIFNWENRPELTAAVLKIPTRNCYVCLFLFWFFQWKSTLITWATDQNIHLQIFIPFRLFYHPVDFCHAISLESTSVRHLVWNSSRHVSLSQINTWSVKYFYTNALNQVCSRYQISVKCNKWYSENYEL